MKGLFETGPSAVLSIVSRVDEQAEWLQRVQPHYLLTYPSALRELLVHCRDRGIAFPRLRELRTLSELLPPETRRLAREVGGPTIARKGLVEGTGVEVRVDLGGRLDIKKTTAHNN